MEKLIYKIKQIKELNKHEFTTIAGITYACYFILAEHLFMSYPDVAPSMYVFTLEVENGDVRQQGLDEKIGNTVCHIIEDFLLQNTYAAIYLCDASDRKELPRKRKFDTWFSKWDSGKIAKFDNEIQGADYRALNTLLISKKHPLFHRIVTAFQELIQNAEDKNPE